MIDALVREISDKAQVPTAVVKKVLRTLPEVVLDRALREKDTNIPGLVTFSPSVDKRTSSPTIKCSVSKRIKERFRALQNKGLPKIT